MSVIFPAGTNSKIVISPVPSLKKRAQFDMQVEPEQNQSIDSSGPGPAATGLDEAPVSDISIIEEPNPAFDAIRSLPGFEKDVAEIDALEGAGAEQGAEGDVAAAAAKIEDAAMQIADAAKALAGEPVGTVDTAVEAPVGLESPETDKPASDNPFADKPADDKPADDKPADDKPADDKPCDDKPCDDKPADDKPSEDKPADDKIEKESSPEKAEKEASVKQGISIGGFTPVAKLSPENKTFLRTYLKDILGFPAEYVDAMVTDYEK